MEQTISFFVDDTSPTVSYSPISDTLSTPNLTVSWNPYYGDSGFAHSIGDTGKGDTYHVTSMDGGLLSISWKGTGVQLLGYSNGSDYEVLLNGTVQTSLGASVNNKILATFQNLTDAVHNVTLRTKLPATPGPPLRSLFFDKALITANSDIPTSSTITRRNLTDHSVSYNGPWSSETISDRPVHVSKNVGDWSATTFNGSSFMLTGITSPDSGKYSVTLDNQTTTYSGRSSFVQRDTLLFFASGLNPNQTHDLRVVNEDGSELSLNADGFTVFVPEPQPNPPTSTPTPSSALNTSGGSIPKGTIAALVLGGLLAFLAITGLLFFYFVIRPRRRLARQSMQQRPHPHTEPKEHPDVLNIIGTAPAGRGGVFTYHSNLGYVRDDDSTVNQDHAANLDTARSSVPSGFARWKRDLEGSLEGLGLSIRFRHSDSTGGRSRRSGTNEESGERSAKSSRFGSRQGSWSRMSWKGKKKAKGSPHASAGSWSPGTALELPVRPLSRASFEESKDKETEMDSKPPSITSGLTSLSYMTYPQAQAGPTTPHAYAFTHENSRRSSTANIGKPLGPRQSLTRSVPMTQTQFNSTSRHSRRASANLLLAHGGEPNIIVEDEMSQQSHSYEPIIGAIIPPTPQDHGDKESPAVTESTPREDRGSANNTTDGSTSYLGSGTTRQTIRNLSPRTSHIEREAPVASSSRPGSRDKQLRPDVKPPSAGPSRIRPKEASSRAVTPNRAAEQTRPDTALTHGSSQGPDSSFLEVGSPENPSLEMRAEEGLSTLSSSPPQIRGSFLEIRSPSPLQVDLSGLALEELKQDSPIKAGSGLQEKRTTMISSTSVATEDGSKPPDPILRLTPDLRPLAHGRPARDRNGSISFLDFTSSSDTSSRTRSTAPSEFSSRYPGSISAQLQQQYGPSSFPSGNQRLSTALSHSTERTHSSNLSGPSSSPPSNRDSFFPYPVTFAPSSPFYNPSMQQMQLNPPQPSPTSAQPGTRPPPPAPIIVPPRDVGNVRASNGSDGLGRHPTSIVISPTDSVPMSVSELRFRHSDSTSGSLSARLPPHPPLPSSPRSRTEFVPPPLSPPSYIVQQVLGRSPDPNVGQNTSAR